MTSSNDIENQADLQEEELFERWRCQVDKGQTPLRVDKYLTEHMAGTSRNRIQTAADAERMRHRIR